MKSKIVYGPRGEKLFFIDGRQVSRREFDRRFPSKIKDLLRTRRCPAAAAPGAYPKRSVALAVHPEQVAEANERNKRCGVAARYDKDGTCVIPSRADQKKLVALEGMFNKDGGYGD